MKYDLALIGSDPCNHGPGSGRTGVKTPTAREQPQAGDRIPAPGEDVRRIRAIWLTATLPSRKDLDLDILEMVDARAAMIL
jgi:hypothetical protein